MKNQLLHQQGRKALHNLSLVLVDVVPVDTWDSVDTRRMASSRLLEQKKTDSSLAWVVQKREPAQWGSFSKLPQ